MKRCIIWFYTVFLFYVPALSAFLAISFTIFNISLPFPPLFYLCVSIKHHISSATGFYSQNYRQKEALQLLLIKNTHIFTPEGKCKTASSVGNVFALPCFFFSVPILNLIYNLCLIRQILNLWVGRVGLPLTQCVSI